MLCGAQRTKRYTFEKLISDVSFLKSPSYLRLYEVSTTKLHYFQENKKKRNKKDPLHSIHRQHVYKLCHSKWQITKGHSESQRFKKNSPRSTHCEEKHNKKDVKPASPVRAVPINHKAQFLMWISRFLDQKTSLVGYILPHFAIHCFVH